MNERKSVKGPDHLCLGPLPSQNVGLSIQKEAALFSCWNSTHLCYFH